MTRKSLKHNKTQTRKNKTIGGKNFQNVEVFYKDKPLKCDVCGKNNYYQRDSTLGRSKAATWFYRDAFFSKISIYTLFCNECGKANVFKKDGIFESNSKKLSLSQLKNEKSIEHNITWIFRPLKI